MIDFGRPGHLYHEFEHDFRGDTVMIEVIRIYMMEEFDPEGFFYPTGYLYEFKVLTYFDLVQNYEIDVSDTLSHEENVEMQKLIDEWCADQAADAAERRADR